MVIMSVSVNEGWIFSPLETCRSVSTTYGVSSLLLEADEPSKTGWSSSHKATAHSSVLA